MDHKRLSKMKTLKLREDSGIDLSLKNLIAIVIGVSMGIFAYTEITARLTSLETSRELMNSDLLKASDQKTIDGEQYLILESAIEDLEKLTIRVDEMMHNGVNISRMIKDIDRLRNDVEILKDKVRDNGSH